MNKGDYRIIGYETRPLTGLKPHKAAELPIDEEDLVAIVNSIRESGAILTPLLVTPNGQVLDGCNRLVAARAAGLETAPCLIVEADDPRAVALECLATRRKCTTGQRVLAYIEQHKAAVLAAAEENADPGNRSPGRAGKKLVSRDSSFTTASIAARLGCSNKDVVAAVDLVRAKEESAAVTAKGEFDPLDVVIRHVMQGVTPIRRWRAAAAGRAAPQKGKASVNFAEAANRAMHGILFAFENWTKIPPPQRAILEEYWAKTICKKMPEQLRLVTR